MKQQQPNHVGTLAPDTVAVEDPMGIPINWLIWFLFKQDVRHNSLR